MGLGLPQPVFDCPAIPDRFFNITDDAPPAGEMSFEEAMKNVALGRVPNDGKVSVAAVDACTMNCFIFIPYKFANGSHFGQWFYAGAGTSEYQKVFAALSLGSFKAPVGALFYLSVTASDADVYVSGLLPNGQQDEPQ